MIASVVFLIHIYYIARAALLAYLETLSNKSEVIYKEPVYKPYTVIVGLYKEVNVINQLVTSLSKIDYPVVQFIFATEEDDLETREELYKYSNLLDYTVLTVPAPKQGEYKTKPRALNYALNITTGDYLVIFDAEDQPDPDQLKKAAAALQSNEKLACVQANLRFVNFDDNWLTQMFSIEYWTWFGGFVSGLAKAAYPVPLGGTSNHFKTDVLKNLGGWDPLNVTEDCELGMRLAKNGYKVGHIDSTTWEEAVGKFWPWVKQRTRWMKGYIYTYLTTSKAGSDLKSLVSWHLFVLGVPLVSLINPFLITITFYNLFTGKFAWIWPTKAHWSVAMISLVLGNGISIILPAIRQLKDRQYKKALLCVTFPIYWLLHSIAAYRAVYQMIFDPHTWEKTEHGVSKKHNHL